MSLILTFMELDKLYESAGLSEDTWLSRQALIRKIQDAGFNYNFDKYTDAQLYRICGRIKNKTNRPVKSTAATCTSNKKSYEYCSNCGQPLYNGEYCSICGPDDLYESIFDSVPSTNNWVTFNKTNNSANQSATTSVSSTNQTNQANVVTIVYDNKAHKLRARADDGIHGEANVAFPNNLRNREGQQYKVDDLVWNGKNYRAVGNIVEI